MQKKTLIERAKWDKRCANDNSWIEFIYTQSFILRKENSNHNKNGSTFINDGKRKEKKRKSNLHWNFERLFIFMVIIFIALSNSISVNVHVYDMRGFFVIFIFGTTTYSSFSLCLVGLNVLVVAHVTINIFVSPLSIFQRIASWF